MTGPRALAGRAEALATLAEIFREHGYEGASLSLITGATGLGKGSLYHFFPGGKKEMMAAVLADIDSWFEAEIFAPLAQASNAGVAIDAMFAGVTDYFRSGRRACLVGALGIGAARDGFAQAITGYFDRWIAALQTALAIGGAPADATRALAEDTVAGIQGAILLSRALDDAAVYHRVIRQLRGRMLFAIGRPDL